MTSSFQSRLGSAPEEGVKSPCVTASIANLTLSGEQTVNSVAVVAGNRVLVRAQTDATENGIYDASTGAWTRATDWNANNDVIAGMLVVDSGTPNVYMVTFAGDFTLDTTEPSFAIADIDPDAILTLINKIIVVANNTITTAANGNLISTELNAALAELQTDIDGRLSEQTIGIADDNLVEIDHASVADNDYAKFTANGVEGRNYAEVLSDIGGASLTAANAFTAIQKFDKGADVASGSTLTLGTDGNYFDITGTTTITAIATIQIGTVVKLHFDGALILTHHATDLILPGGANITTAAGDEVEFIEYATGDWRCINYSFATGLPLASSHKIVQVVNTQVGTVATGTTTLPIDDTTPQNTEGDEYMTLAITPTNASNKLKIEVVASLSSTIDHNGMTLFQDSTANAIAAMGYSLSNQWMVPVKLTHYMTAGTTSSTTFKVRAGGRTTHTTTFNGQSAGQIFNGIMASSITITEIIP